MEFKEFKAEKETIVYDKDEKAIVTILRYEVKSIKW